MTTSYVNDADSIRRAKAGDACAMEEVVTTNLGLVKSIALRFVGRGAELEDLIQIGTIGMIRAVLGFDVERECRFTTYAVPMIAGEIKRFLRSDGWIKIGREAKQNAVTIFRFIEEYEKKNGATPTMDIICHATGLDEEKAVFAMEASRPALSLYDEDEETGFSPEKIVGEDKTDQVIGKIAVGQMLTHLAREERALIEMRYFKGMTQEQTARVLHCTQVKVSREEKRILAKLRKEFT